MCQSLEKLAHDEVRVKIVSRGAGNVTESDVMLASASGAIVIAFSVGVEPTAASLADREKIEIRQYKVIYDAINEIKAALEGCSKPCMKSVYRAKPKCVPHSRAPRPAPLQAVW
jgi:translation initiation factor IF-2